jgi:hypothetical protein
MASAFALGAALTGCGVGTGVDGGTDGLTGSDLAVSADMAFHHLPSGVWVVSAPVTVVSDGCNVSPNDANNPTAGLIYALQNMGQGVIELSNPTDPDNPGNMQQYDTAETGNPPQPVEGASCPATNAPAQCATEPNALAFANVPNEGWLVRDNDNGVQVNGTCFYHRHIVNKVTITSDTTFHADYSRTDTLHNTCTQTTDCTSTWGWDFSFVKAFGT